LIAGNAIAEQRGNAVFEEDGRAVDSPTGLEFLETTGVVPRGIEPSPEDRQSAAPRSSAASNRKESVASVTLKNRSYERCTT
jgi:hypothetical protein